MKTKKKELEHCKKCNQMTNHSLLCLKCDKQKDAEIKRLEIENKGLIKTMNINLLVRNTEIEGLGKENKNLRKRLLVSEDGLATNEIIKTQQEIDYYYLKQENQKLKSELKQEKFLCTSIDNQRNELIKQFDGCFEENQNMKEKELFCNSNETIIKELNSALEGWQKDFHRVDEENQKLQESKQMWKRSSQLKGLKILGLNSAFDKLKKKIDDLEF